MAGVHAAYLDAIAGLRGRRVSTHDVASRVKLAKSPAEYRATRDARREHAYEAMLAAGRETWEPGERVRVYRATGGPALADDERDPRDYDVEHYVRVLRETFAARFARAFTADDFATLFGDPDQLTLFGRPIASIRSVLTRA